LIPFNFSTTQSYILEFFADLAGAGIRFYANYGQVQVAGSPYVVLTEYLAADLPLLRFVQSADVLYIVHPNYPPAKLQRFGATNWHFSNIQFQDGPYLPINITQMVMEPAATSGTNVSVVMGPNQAITGAVADISGQVKITIANHGWTSGQMVSISGVVGTVEANGRWLIDVTDVNTFSLRGSVFVHSYISGGTLYPTNPFQAQVGLTGSIYLGTPVRIEQSGTWGWGILTGITNDYTFTVNINPVNDFNATTPSKSWAIGVWPGGSLQGSFFPTHVDPPMYPGNVTFHQDRLCFSGAPSYPQRVDMSMTSNYETFSPSGYDGTVSASDAISLYLNATDVNQLYWLNSDDRGLLSGSSSAEWLIRPSVLGDAISPTDVLARRGSKWGSAPGFAAFLVGKCTLYVQRGARKIRELLYDIYIDGYRATDLTELAEHITGTGIVDWTYQSLPISTLWFVRNDGVLLGMTYDRDQSQLRTGWHQHVLGGVSDAGGSPPVVESVATIPSPDGTKDDLWMIVRRYINGQTVRTIEYMAKIYEDTDGQQNAVMLDCSSTYNNPITITGATNANPIVVHAPSHGFSTGNFVRIDGVVGFVQSGVSILNGKWFKITVTDSNHFSLQNEDTGVNVDGSGASVYVSGGQVRKLVTTISGLTYLENETVSIYADGANQAPQTVSNSGTITLPLKAAVVTIGYPFISDAQLLRLDSGSRNGTSFGKTRRIHRVGLLVHASQGLMIGKDFNNLDPVQFRTQGVDLNSFAAPLFSGLETHTVDFDYDFDNQLCLRVSGGMPCTILGIYPMLETQDRA
jgi:hypothetical protein